MVKDKVNKAAHFIEQINVKLLKSEKIALNEYCEKMATTKSQLVRRLIQNIISGKIVL